MATTLPGLAPPDLSPLAARIAATFPTLDGVDRAALAGLTAG